MCTYIHIYEPTYIHIHAYVRTYMHTYVRTCMHTYVRTYVRAYIRTCIHKHSCYAHLCHKQTECSAHTTSMRHSSTDMGFCEPSCQRPTYLDLCSQFCRVLHLCALFTQTGEPMRHASAMILVMCGFSAHLAQAEAVGQEVHMPVLRLGAADLMHRRARALPFQQPTRHSRRHVSSYPFSQIPEKKKHGRGLV